MIIVLDASAAAEIAGKTQNGVDFINVMLQSESVLAPELYISEVTNVMWKLGRNDNDNFDSYMEIAGDCIDYVDEYFDTTVLWKEALKLAQEHDHAVYDMLYAVLARRNDAMLLTLDKKLTEICSKISVHCFKQE